MSDRPAGVDLRFLDALAGLKGGDFSRLAPLFASQGAALPPIMRWHIQGRFRDHPFELAEALTCACFVGATDVAEYLLAQGLDASGGIGTGLNAVHWAANRGQLAAVRLLIARHAPLETRNMYGGTVLGCAVWSAVHEPRAGQIEAIEALLEAGAVVSEAEYPSGDARVDEMLRRYGRG